MAVFLPGLLRATEVAAEESLRRNSKALAANAFPALLVSYYCCKLSVSFGVGVGGFGVVQTRTTNTLPVVRVSETFFFWQKLPTISNNSKP